MFYLYVIRSVRFGRIYIGISGNVKKRLKEHNQGLVRSTKAYHPYQLIYIEIFPTKTLARKREIELKKHGQKRELLLEYLRDRRFPPAADQP